MYACKSLKIQGNLCIEFYAQKCERNSIRGRRIFIGFPDKFAKPAFYAGLVSLDFTGDNRRGAPQRSNQCGDCYSTQKSVHKSGVTVPSQIYLWKYFPHAASLFKMFTSLAAFPGTCFFCEHSKSHPVPFDK